jgi:hypothetical protein
MQLHAGGRSTWGQQRFRSCASKVISTVPNLHDYLLRLKQTSAEELAHRGRRVLLARGLKKPALNRQALIDVPELDPTAVRRLKLPQLIEDRRFEKNNAGPNTLNTSYTAIRRFEQSYRHRFFADVDQNAAGSDIRSVWEPARLQHLVAPLLEAGAESDPVQRRAKCLRIGKRALRWLSENPYLLGPHYMSPMECGLRIPVFFYCLKLIADERSDAFCQIACGLYRHAWWVYRNLSLYNSIGNHTICECIGLVFAGAVYRATRQGRKWLECGCNLLDREIHCQILPDGGPIEQSLSYHRFVLDLYCLAFSFLRRNELHPCRTWQTKLETGEAFLSAFSLGNNGFPRIGDGDDGRAVALDVAPKRLPGARLFSEGMHTFSDSGYSVIRGANGLLLTFDHGPLGMAPLYNHGHADALSITLAYSGKEVLIDPGTYRYNGFPSWRRYFKSTRAHNTVTVDGRDQAEQASGFIWTQPYRCTVVEKQSGGGRCSIAAFHDGYRRLNTPLSHLRKVVYWRPNAFLVQDRFAGNGRHDFELTFHLGEIRGIDTINDWWHVDFGAFMVFMRVFEPVSARVICGQVDPPMGWKSPAYGIKMPSKTISFHRAGPAHGVRFTTAIIIQDAQRGAINESAAQYP